MSDIRTVVYLHTDESNHGLHVIEIKPSDKPYRISGGMVVTDVGYKSSKLIEETDPFYEVVSVQDTAMEMELLSEVYTYLFDRFKDVPNLCIYHNSMDVNMLVKRFVDKQSSYVQEVAKYENSQILTSIEAEYAKRTMVAKDSIVGTLLTYDKDSSINILCPVWGKGNPMVDVPGAPLIMEGDAVISGMEFNQGYHTYGIDIAQYLSMVSINSDSNKLEDTVEDHKSYYSRNNKPRSGLIGDRFVYSIPGVDPSYICMAGSLEIGRRIADVGYTVTKFSGEDSIDSDSRINLLINRFRKEYKIETDPLVLVTGTLSNRNFLYEFNRFGKDCIRHYRGNYKIVNTDTTIFDIIDPPLMLLEAHNTFNFIIEMYEEYVKDSSKFEIVDLKDEFYEDGKLKSNFTNAVKFHAIRHNKKRIRFNFGNEIIDRNSLNKIKELESFDLVLFKHNSAQYYFTVLTSKEGVVICHNPLTGMLY